MEDLGDCKKINFGNVEPGKVYSKHVKINSPFIAKRTTRCGEENPLERVFHVSKDAKFPDEANHFVVKYKPFLPLHKSFGVERIEFEDGSKQLLSFIGETKEPDVKLSFEKIYFKTNPSMNSSHFLLQMENYSDCSDVFCWDYIPQDSEVLITPQCGTIRGNSKVDISVNFQPRRQGLFYHAFACLFKYQEPLFVDVFGFHHTPDKNLPLLKYITLDEASPSYATNYCRYMNDCAVRIRPESKPTISLSTRFVHFGNIATNHPRPGFSQEIFLTNHAEKDLIVQWSSDVCRVFEVTPRSCRLKRNDGIGWFSVKFNPNVPEVFYSGEMHCSFSWGLQHEYRVPFSITVQAVGSSFSSEDLVWKPQHHISETRIVLPGTVPNVPSYVSFQINNNGTQPLQFSLEPENKKKRPFFVVKPLQGIIIEEFQLVVVQMFPSEEVDVFYKEDWLLVLNGIIKVKLELCGSSELPFLMVASNKDVDFPSTSVGTITTLLVPIKNPTRLELEYQCLECLSANTFSADRKARRIGSGEQHFIEVSFHPENVGYEKSSMGIAMKWAPRHSAPLKFLGGREITSETVVRFTGTSEYVNVTAHPPYMTLPEILLNDWGIDSFSVSNSGTSTVYLRLECKPLNWMSREMPYKMEPNDLTLQPGETETVKVYLLGIERGFNEFLISYELYRTSSFLESTGVVKPIITCSLFVDYPSLSVLDIRYAGLAKSLSKAFLWNLLQINSLNKTLGELERGNNHHFMKMPEYSEHSPTLIIELLLKNTSVYPLDLTVDLRKNCDCPPKKADTISRRIFLHKCKHEEQLYLSIRNKAINPGETTVLSLTAEYDTVDFNIYTIWLRIAIGEEKRCKTLVFIDVERSIVSSRDQSLNFFLPPADKSGIYNVRFEDVYIGDTSKYIQVLWLYNHSQFDCRFWAEWLIVNHKIFKLINESGTIISNTSQPVYIQFTPYEMKTYEAEVAIVTEYGMEFHIIIEGTGSIVYQPTTASMLYKMPATSLFEPDPLHLELSADHICIKPMPTHSYDKYIFFMKNNSNEVIHFFWDKLVVWSVMKVIVEPKEGTLLPWEVIPVQMNIHTFRLPAILNFAVECSYYKNVDVEAYYKKSAAITKTGVLFDTCFVLEPDKEIEIAYRTPHLGAKAGETPRNNMISVGASIHIFNAEFKDVLIPNRSDQNKFLPKPLLDLERIDHSTVLTGNQFGCAVEALKRIMRDVVHTPMFQDAIRKRRPPIRYVDLPNKNEEIRQSLARRPMALLLTSLIYSACMIVFEIDPIIHHADNEEIVPKTSSESRFMNIRNAYYEKMLGDESGQVIYFSKMKIRRLKSRDHITRVRRASSIK